MTFIIDDLSTLDPTLVQQTHAFITQLVQEENPTIDVKRGVLDDLLNRLGAILEAKSQTEQDAQRRSTSLLEIQNDPQLADDAIVDNVLSNFRVDRLPGNTAIGSVTIVLGSAIVVTIPAGATFIADGKSFTTENVFTSQPTSATVLSTFDRVLTPLGDGTFSFVIEVVALDEGEESQLIKDTLIVPDGPPEDYITSFATADFIGGLSQETNAELILRLAEGISVKAFSGRTAMSAFLRDQEAFERILQDSLIGLGDEEMLRDQHSIFPGSHGGRGDWYIRTQGLYQSIGLVKTATLVEKTVDNRGIWQFSIGRDEASGFYDVSEIVINDGGATVGSFDVTEDIRSIDLTPLDNDGFLPDIDTVEEGVYSRFQAAVIRFLDETTDTTTLVEGASEQDYAVTVRAMPLIKDIQDFTSARGSRNFAGDALIKAPIPCFLVLSFKIILKPGQEDPDKTAIADALATFVNNYGFTGRLPASALSDVVHDSLLGIASTGAIDMFGQIRRPDGSTIPLRSTEVIEIPDEPQNMVTAKTTMFILDPADVAISTVIGDIPAI